MTSDSNIGSGVLIWKSKIDSSTASADDSLLILTCAHLFTPSDIATEVAYITYADPNDGKVRFGVADPVAYNFRLDLCLCEFRAAYYPANATDIPGVELCDPAELKTGQSIMIIGNTLGADEFSCTGGVVREAFYAFGEYWTDSVSKHVPPSFLTVSKAGPGNSGGGVFSVTTGKLLGLLIYSFINLSGMMDGVTHPLTSWRALKKMVSQTGRLGLSFKNFRYFYPTSSNLGWFYSSLQIDPARSLQGVWSSGGGHLGLSPFDYITRVVPLDAQNQEIADRAIDLGTGAPFVPFDFVYALFDPDETIRAYVQKSPSVVGGKFAIGAGPPIQIEFTMDSMPLSLEGMFSGSLSLSRQPSSSSTTVLTMPKKNVKFTTNPRKIEVHQEEGKQKRRSRIVTKRTIRDVLFL